MMMRRRIQVLAVLASGMWSFTHGAFLSASIQRNTSNPIASARTLMGGAVGFGSIRALQLEFSEAGNSAGSRPIIYRLVMPDRFQMDNGVGVFTLDSHSFTASTGLTERGLAIARQNTVSAYVRTWLLFLLAAPAGSDASFKPVADRTIDGVSVSSLAVTVPGGVTMELWFSQATHRPFGYRFTSAITTASGGSAGSDTSEVRVRSFQTVDGVEFPKEIETTSSRAENFVAKRAVRVIVNPTAEVDKFFVR